MESNIVRNGWIADDASSLRPSGSGLALLRRLSTGRQSLEVDFAPFEHLKIKSGASLIQAGQAFEALLLVKSGYLKTVFTDEGGNEQVVSFPVIGDLLGTDGIGNGRYINDVIALSGVEVIRIPFTDLKTLQQADPEIVDTLFRIISYQLVQEQLALTAIGALCADARVARFLLKIGLQDEKQDHLDQSLHLWMTRQDMGNYLGMKIETVSRTLTLLSSRGLIRVNQRVVEILDPVGLKGIAYNGSPRQGPLLVRQRRSRMATVGTGLKCSDARSDQLLAGPVCGGTRVHSTPWSALLDL